MTNILIFWSIHSVFSASQYEQYKIIRIPFKQTSIMYKVW